MRASSSLASGSIFLAMAAGRKIVHALESDVDRQLSFAGQLVRNRERDARLHGLEPAVEIVHVDFQRLALFDFRQFLRRLSGQVRQHAHDEWNVLLFHGAVGFQVVFDLHARGTIARDELLTTFLTHTNLLECTGLRRQLLYALAFSFLKPANNFRLRNSAGRQIAHYFHEIFVNEPLRTL